MFFLIAQDLIYAVRDVDFLDFNTEYAAIFRFFPSMDDKEIPLASTKLFLQIVEDSSYEYDTKASLTQFLYQFDRVLCPSTTS